MREIATDGVPEGVGDFSGHLLGLRLPAHEAADRHDRDPGGARQVAVVPLAVGHVRFNALHRIPGARAALSFRCPHSGDSITDVPAVSTRFLTMSNFFYGCGATLVPAVGSRITVKAPKFGKALKLRRGKKSLEEVAIPVRKLLEDTGLKIPRSLIDKIERGRVPDWPIFAALCRVYGMDIERAVLQLLNALEFPGSRDLLRQPEGVELASNPELAATSGGDVSDDLTSSRVFAEEIRRIADAFGGALQDVADRLDGGLPNTPTHEPNPHTPHKPTHRLRRAR